ncbi:MAG: PDZ domain-containing protein, partial [Verrucomicrobia bacterium]|nr:PDZ domain-containing protein [Verrucomicrobiota bacterium]
IAIGAPFELERTVTFGHLSAKGRDGVLEDRRLDQDYLQTDAQINPGNSGGPLVNISGEVIGINTLVRGIRTGIGFAIPVNHAQRVADQLIRNGRYSRSWIGIAVQPVNETPQLKSMFPETEQGLVVKQIDRTGPAGGTDLKPGDLIVSIDGHPTFKPRDLKDAIRAKDPGTVVQICINRGGKLTTIKLKTEEMPVEGEGRQARDSGEDSGETGREEFFGLRMEVVPDELAKREGLDRRQGVLISDVRAGSVAEQCGIRPGSVLTEINRKPVTHPKQAREMLQTLSKAPSVAVSIVRYGQASFEILQAPGL